MKLGRLTVLFLMALACIAGPAMAADMEANSATPAVAPENTEAGPTMAPDAIQSTAIPEVQEGDSPLSWLSSGLCHPDCDVVHGTSCSSGSAPCYREVEGECWPYLCTCFSGKWRCAGPFQ